LKDIGTFLKEKNRSLDFILISGDIANSGKESEYNYAYSFLKELSCVCGISLDRIFLAPGNHDVNRTMISNGDRAIGRSLNSEERVADFYCTDKDRKAIFSRLDNYFAFSEKTMGNKLGNEEFGKHLVQFIDKDGFRVALIGLNSAWLSGFRDQLGRLCIGKPQIAHALDATQGADLRIVFFHHPLNWLREFDREFTETNLKRYCDFILTGHLHKEQVIIEKSLEGVSTLIPAGACYAGPRYPNCYNFVFFNLVSREGVVYLRRFSERIGEWVKDVHSTGDENDGKIRFSFSLRDKTKVAVLLPYEFKNILDCFPFEEHLQSEISTDNASPLTFRNYYFQRIDEAEKSLNDILPFSKIIFINLFLFKALSKYKPLISFIKENEEKMEIGYSTEKIIQAFAMLLINEYGLKEKGA